MYILYMLVLNNTPFVHARVYLQYLKSALPGKYLHKTREFLYRLSGESLFGPLIS